MLPAVVVDDEDHPAGVEAERSGEVPSLIALKEDGSSGDLLTGDEQAGHGCQWWRAERLAGGGTSAWSPAASALKADLRSRTLRCRLVVGRSASRHVTTEDGVRLAVTVSGDGEPLVMIPGLGATRRVYSPIIPALERRFTVIVYDPRGAGDSNVSAGPYTMSRLASDCAAVATAVGAETFHLFGASMGGLTAQHVALRYKSRVARLVLGCTGPGRHTAVPASPQAMAAILGRGARSPGDAYRTACTVLYSRRFQRDHPEFIDAEVAHRAGHPVAARAFTAQFRASRDIDLGDRLREISAPTLVLHGTEDELVPLANAEMLAKLIPGARRYWFDGCGHLFFHEEPGLTDQVILSFLG
jgi:pimeloyl-ACP methyl ester carboxylesterase